MDIKLDSFIKLWNIIMLIFDKGRNSAVLTLESSGITLD